MQANVGAKYELTTTFLNLLSPRDAATGEISDSFDSVDDIYTWIDAKFLDTFWQNPMCGDNTCDMPDEYPAFFSYGCQADCGSQRLTTAVVVRAASKYAYDRREPYVDGETDDGEAIRHAVEEGDGLLRFPPGEYRVTEPVEIPLSEHGPCGLEGSGGTARIIMAGPGPAFRLVGEHGGTVPWGARG